MTHDTSSLEDVLPAARAGQPWALRAVYEELAPRVHGYLRGLLSELASKDVAGTIRILYGGSVKPENVEPLAAEPDIDGALVGGASLNAQAFVTISEGFGRM